MPKKPFGENDDPGNYDLIISSLKENNDDLNALLNEVRTISDRIGNVCELTTFKRLEEKLLALQDAVSDFTKSAQFAKTQTETASLAMESKKETQSVPFEITEEKIAPMIVKCNNWDDFQSFAQKAETVSFTYRETEKLFEADALKNNQIIAFIGEMPRSDQLLKMWLCSKLVTSEKNVFQGTISKA